MKSTALFIILSVAKNLMLNKIQLYLTIFCSILFNTYPSLYKFMGYFFTMLYTFDGYFYSIAFNLHNKFKNNFTIIYCIALYIYSEYLAIVKGDLSKNIGVIISLYILFYLDKQNFLLYTVLLLSVVFKEYLLKQLWIQKNYPVLYYFLVDILSLIITIVIFYFLDLIFINTIKPLLLKF
jgi:hypothetical protein